MMSKDGKKFIDKLRGEIITDQLKTGKHYIVTANGIPVVQCTRAELTEFAEYVKDKLRDPEQDWANLQVLDTFTHKKVSLKEYLEVKKT